MKKRKSMSVLAVCFRQLKIIARKKRKYLFLTIFVYAVCAGILPLLAVFLPRYIIDSLTLGESLEKILTTIGIFCGSSLVLAIGVALSNALNQGGFLSLRIDEFTELNAKYLTLDYKYMEDAIFRDNFEVSIEALSGDEMGFQGLYKELAEIFPLLLSVILYIIVISVFNPLIAVACFVSAGIALLVNRSVALYEARRQQDQAQAFRQKNYFYNISFDFSYGKDIRVYDLQEKLVGDRRAKSVTYVRVIKDLASRRFLLGLLELICLLAQDAAAYFFIIRGYFSGAIGLGEVSLYVSAVIALSTALRSFNDRATSLIRDAHYSSNYFDFLDDTSYISFTGTQKALPAHETLDIEFRDVSFRYPRSDRYILRHFNFHIAAGEKLAIVGTNGAGKSTIVKLLTGLFMPDEGQILINGTDIREFSRTEYQKMFSVVYQEVNVFAASLLENVIGTAAEPSARERGLNCLKRVGLKEKVDSLPHGCDTALLKVVDEEGVELSGGQYQKIAIARALYKDGNMVILDEPTSALDALAEAEIYQSFDDLVAQKTAIYISHRLSSTKFCDKIALFNSDGLAEYGSHDELMAKRGEYYKMFEIQGRYYQEGENYEKA